MMTVAFLPSGQAVQDGQSGRQSPLQGIGKISRVSRISLGRLKSTIRYLDIELDDALEISEPIEI
jgi:hypothetical protein